MMEKGVYRNGDYWAVVATEGAMGFEAARNDDLAMYECWPTSMYIVEPCTFSSIDELAQVLFPKAYGDELSRGFEFIPADLEVLPDRFDMRSWLVDNGYYPESC